MNKNTDSNINSEKVYSIHSISNGNISAPIILEQNNDVIQGTDTNIEPNNDKIIMSSIAEAVLDIKPKEYSFTDLSTILDRIDNVILKTIFSSKRVNVDEYSGIYYEDCDSDIETGEIESHNKGIKCNRIIGCGTYINIPGGMVIYHHSNQMLFNYTNIEFMLRHFCIPLEFTNLETDLKYKIKRSNGSIQECIMYSSDSMKISKSRDKISIPLHFTYDPSLIEKENNYSYEYDSTKMVMFDEFVELNNIHKFVINIPHYYLRTYEDNSVSPEIASQLTEHYQTLIGDHLNKYQVYFDSIAKSTEISGNTLVVTF